MAGLNNLLSDSQQTTTTMPAWYDQAQQAIVNQGTQAAAAAPTMANTTAQQAINTLQGPSNPFTQAQGTLQQISSGAANPWITDASGNVTPNTQTAMGGLFQAENQQLNQLMPNYTAGAEAAGIGSGNFGSLRGMTAVDKAKADAFSNLTAQQMAAALQNQQTGQAAAANLGNVGSQGISSEMNVGTAQQNAPFQTPGNLASLLGTLQAPTTVTSQKQLSPLGQMTTLGNTLQGGLTALGNTAAGASLLKTLGLTGLVPGSNKTTVTGGGTATTGGGGLVTPGGSTSGSIAGGGSYDASSGQTTYPLQGGGSITMNSDGTQTIYDANGNATNYDASGNQITMNPGSGANAQDLQNQMVNQDQADAYGSTAAISGTDSGTPVVNTDYGVGTTGLE